MIYVIGPEGDSIVKIGHTANKPADRMGNLQTGNPKQLVVLWSAAGDQALERHLHAVFSQHRVRGEWFDLSDFPDPIQAVKDEVQKANARRSQGESLLVGERYRAPAALPTPPVRAQDRPSWNERFGLPDKIYVAPGEKVAKRVGNRHPRLGGAMPPAGRDRLRLLTGPVWRPWFRLGAQPFPANTIALP